MQVYGVPDVVEILLVLDCSSGISLIHISFLKIPTVDFLKYIKKINKKGGLKIAFYVDVNVFSLSNLTILKADISKTSSEQYQFLFIFICRTSKYTHMQKIKKFYREVNYVHLALSLIRNKSKSYQKKSYQTFTFKHNSLYHGCNERISILIFH